MRELHWCKIEKYIPQNIELIAYAATKFNFALSKEDVYKEK